MSVENYEPSVCLMFSDLSCSRVGMKWPNLQAFAHTGHIGRKQLKVYQNGQKSIFVSTTLPSEGCTFFNLHLHSQV